MSARTYHLKPMHRQIALLSALFYTPADIAAETGYAIQTINLLLRRPEMQQLVQRYESDRMAQQKLAVQAELMADAPTNFKAIKQIRDNNLSGEHADHRVALSAATVLFDRQVPRITKHEEEKHIHIHLSRDEQQQGAAVLEEDKLLDLDEANYAIEDADEVEVL